MSQTRVICFADSVSGTAVQLRQHPGLQTNPNSDPPLQIQSANLVLEGTAEATFWSADCTKYEVIIRRLT